MKPTRTVLAPSFVFDTPKPAARTRLRCRACNKLGGIPREEAKGLPVCPECYHQRANQKLLEVAKAKLIAWLRGS